MNEIQKDFHDKRSESRWAKDDAGQTGGTSEAMSNKLLKLLGGNKIGNKTGTKK